MKKRIIFGIFLALIFMSPAVSLAQTPVLPEVQTYDQLVAAIRQARVASQARVEQAVRQEKVREAWETGRLIDAHVLQHKERADYGKQVILRLSQDLSISDAELYYMLQFARAYPIFTAPGELSWAHYRELLSMNDPKEREAMVSEAVKNQWSQKELREEISKRKAAKGTGSPAESGAPVPLMAQPGKPGTYRVVKAAVGPETGKGVIDLGFSNYYRTSRDLRFKEGAIIEVIPAFPGGASAPSDLIKLSKRTSADLYTYRVYVHRVLDGDTIEAVVDLGFGVRSVQVLRLRGLDAPELVSKEGKEAKAFLESVIASPAGAKQSILIKTIKSDKYDRYLVDIFIDRRPQTADPSQEKHALSFPHASSGNLVYLNNELIEKGHAVRVTD